MASPCLPLFVVATVSLFAGAWGILSDTSLARRQGISAHGAPVQLDVYHESMCPYCHQFFNETLRALWNDDEMRPLVNLRLYPAGNVQSIPSSMVSRGYFFWHPLRQNDSYVFQCQHGESECLGNLIHMCAMKVLRSPDSYMPLFFCMAAQPQSAPERSSFACMQELAILPEPIRDCVFSPTANGEMAAIVQADVGLNRTYVPWVVVNGKHIEINDRKADLQVALCSALGTAAPASCSQLGLSRAVQFAQLPGSDTAVRFGRSHRNATKQVI